MKYWLFKTEPDEFSIEDLARLSGDTEPWGGIRNYQARNFIRDEIEEGDRVFIYHSSCKNVGIAGVAEVTRAAYPDPLQFNPDSKYFDPKSSTEMPRWFQVDIAFVEAFEKVLLLSDIKAMPDITDIGLVNRRSRLSIMPVNAREWTLLNERAKRTSRV